MMYDLIIVGGGPAGLTAAVYARRAGKKTLIIEKDTFGGQITWSPKVENFPSYVSIAGMELGDAMFSQALEQGAEAELDEVLSIEDGGGAKKVVCASGSVFEGKAVIIAAGAKPRTLGLEGEQRLQGSGVCYCAVCDGAFFKGQDVAVNGGGNSALQDAVLLSEICRKVYVIHRRDSFRGEDRLVEALRAKGNVEFILSAKITALKGGDELEGIEVTGDGGTRYIPVSGLFVAIGHEPDLRKFETLLELDPKGYAESGEDCMTKTPGIFVAGDCRKKGVRQLTTAVSDGSAAALAAIDYLDFT